MDIPKIYIDFDNAGRQGRLRLAIRGSKEDIQSQELKLFNGMKLIVYDDELSADAEAIFSEEEQIWVAKIGRI